MNRTARTMRRWAAIGAVMGTALFGLGGSALAAAPQARHAQGGAASDRTRTAGAGSVARRAGTRWAPVPYQGAQLTVPGSWLVESRGQIWCGLPHAGGMIFAGTRPGFPKGYGCRLTDSLAWIVPAGHIPSGLRHRRPTAVLHGLPVYRVASSTGREYLVPALKVRIGARGPLARTVLATLARSPLAVALKRGPAGRVPATWRWRQSGGVRFAVPAAWGTLREDQWATCGTGLSPRSLLLIDATHPPMALPCPFLAPTAAAEQAQPGLAVVTGRYAARSVGAAFARCDVRHGLRVCLASGTGQGGLAGSVLVFSVALPHHHAAAYFVLGLPGSGAAARAILGSVGAAGT
jgi:hypothetical protein